MTETKTIVAFDSSEKAANHGIFGIACNENRNLVYVNNLRTPSLLVIDGETGEYLRNVNYDDKRTGFGLVGWSPVADRLYAVATNQSRLYIFEGETEKLLSSVKLGKGPRGLTIDAKTGNVFVAHYGEGWFGGERTVSSYDADGKNKRTVEVDFNPWEMCANDGVLYVSCKGKEFSRPGTLCAVDIDSMKVNGRVRVGRRPRGIAVKAGKAYVSGRYDYTVSIVDIAEMEVTGRIRVDCDPIGVVAHPDRDLIYVMNRQGEMLLGEPYRGEQATISVIDSKKDTVIKRITTQKTNHYGVINSRTGIMHVAAEDSNDVAAIDTATGEVLRITQLGRLLDRVKMMPGTGQIFSTSHITDELVVMDANEGTLNKTVKIGGWPYVVVVDPETGMAYVSEYDQGTITVFDGSKNTVIDTIDTGTRGHFRPGTPIVENHQYLFSHMAIDAKRKRLYVSSPATGKLLVVDTVKRGDVRAIDLGWQEKGEKIRFWEVAVNEATGLVYLHNPYMSQVTVVEPDTPEVIDRIDVPVLSFAGIGKTSSFAQSGNTIEMLKVDPVRKTLYVGPHIVDIEKNSVTGEIPGELGTVVEHVDVEGRRLYVSRFTEEEMIFQKTDELTVSDADTHELLDVIKLKRPSSVNVAVDSSLGIVISKPLVMGMPFFGEIDIHRIG